MLILYNNNIDLIIAGELSQISPDSHYNTSICGQLLQAILPADRLEGLPTRHGHAFGQVHKPLTGMVI